MDFTTLKVVPILNGKRPGFENWPNLSKPMSEWPPHERWGLVHGPVNGTWALDLDVKSANGLESLAELEARHGALPPTLMVKTPSGGVHLIFKWPEDGGIGNPVGLRPGIDARGEAGQSLIPPSPGYEWDTSHAAEPAAAPSWLLDIVRRREAPEGKLIQDPEAYKEAALTKLSRIEEGNGERQKRTYTVSKDLGRLAKAADWDPEPIILEVKEAARANGLEEWRIEDTVSRAVWEGYAEGGFEVAPPLTLPSANELAEPIDRFLAIDHPPIEMLVRPFISRGALTVVYGAPGSLKTFFALDVAKQAADNGCKVLIIQEEGRPFMLARRFKSMGISGPNIYVMIRRGVRLDESAWEERLTELLAKHHFDLVLLDPFADLHQLDENEQKEMRQLVERIKRLNLSTNTALLLVHHTTKMGWTASKNPDGIGLETLRGAGSLGAALDMAIQIVRDKDLDVFAAEVHPTKDKDCILDTMKPARMTVEGQAKRGEQVVVRWESPEENEERKRALKEAKKDAKQDKSEADDQKALNIIRGEPGIGVGTLAGLLKKSSTYTYAVLERLKDKGLIEKRGRKWEAV